MFFKKKWYVHSSDGYFKSHHLSFHNINGPFTKNKALEVALWHSNQAMRNGSKVIFVVRSDKTTNELVM